MEKIINISRREFVRLTTLAAIGVAPLVNLAGPLFKGSGAGDDKLKVYLFSKHLQFLDYEDLSNIVREMGFDGIDLTVRPKGHVLPERVAEDLPRAAEAMRTVGFRPDLFTSNVLDAANFTDQDVLRVASSLGFQYYRTGWYRYSAGEDIQKNLDIYRKNLQSIARLNEKLGITGSYHNHSGHFMGASIWDLKQALEGISPQHLGVQYDIMHATIEGGKNWEIDFRLIQNHINTLVVKDFIWKKVKGSWKAVHIPMGEGMVDFKKYFSLLKQNQIHVPLSLHCEHDLGGAEKGNKPSIPAKEVFSRIKKDLDCLRANWESA